MIGYRAFGLVVDSNVPLPGATEVAGRADCMLAVRRRPIGDRPVGRRRRIRLPNGRICLTVDRCRSGYLVHFPRVADFRVSRDGRRVTGVPRRGTPVETVAHLFLAQVMPLVLSRRGRFVLHASAVATPHGTIAFLGAAGRGKSTLGASFARQGFPLLADDGLLLVESPSGLVAVPSYPEIRLRHDVLAALDEGGLAVEDIVHRVEKKRVSVERGPWPFSSVPVPVRSLYVLDGEPSAASGAVTITPLGPLDSFMELVRHSYRLDFDDRAALGREFESIARVASRAIVYRLAFPRELARLPGVQAALLEHGRS